VRVIEIFIVGSFLLLHPAYSTRINTWTMAHYCPWACTGPFGTKFVKVTLIGILAPLISGISKIQDDRQPPFDCRQNGWLITGKMAWWRHWPNELFSANPGCNSRIFVWQFLCLNVLVLYDLTSHSTHYRSFWRRFYRSDDPTNSVIALKDDSLPGQGPIPQAQHTKR